MCVCVYVCMCVCGCGCVSVFWTSINSEKQDKQMINRLFFDFRERDEGHQSTIYVYIFMMLFYAECQSFPLNNGWENTNI